MKRRIPAIFYCCIATILAIAGTPLASAQPVTPEELYDLWEKLGTPEVDPERYLDVSGRQVEHEDLQITFGEGVIHPVVRGDGKMVGAVFSGKGEMAFTPPGEREQHQMSRRIGETFYSSEFSSVWILATDDTMVNLIQDAPWATDGGGAPNKVKTIHDARYGLYKDLKWDDYGPSLEMDVLQDLFGEGFLGGYFYAEFHTDPTRWMTYYRNPRSALYPGEEVGFFSHTQRGEAPQTMDIYASYGSSDPDIPRGQGRPYDIANVELEVDIPKPKGGDISRVDITAKLRIVALTDGVKSVMLRLQNRRPRCKGDDPYGELEVQSIRDFEDQPLPALHGRNQMFVLLRAPMNRGDIETLTVTYGGELFESVTIEDQADTYYTALQDFAWYPRALWPDRHSLRTTITTPRFLTGVATGAIKEQVETETGQRFVFDEPGGVLGGMLAVGNYVLTEGQEGSVRILTFTSPRDKQMAKTIIKQTQSMLRYFAALWGPYPYSTLTMLDLPALPMGNWSYELTESVSSTQEAGWTCSPPGHLYAWQGFTTSDTGCLSFNMPATAPAVDEKESRALNYYFVDNPEAQAAYTASMVARQWWDQFVGPATYRDRWITEGVVMLSAALYLGQGSGIRAQEMREESWHDMALRRDAESTLLVGERLGTEFPGVMWGKAPAVMRMMLDELTGEPFITMMRSVMNRAPSGAVTNELFEQIALEYMGTEATAFWDYWVEGVDIPGLRFAYEILDQEDGKFKVEGTLVFEGPHPPTRIPLQLKYSGKDVDSRTVEPTGERTEFVFEDLEKMPKKVLLDPDQRVLLRFRKPLRE